VGWKGDLNRPRGYCYQINGLLAMAPGIQYQFVMARPMLYPVKRLKTHRAIVASVDGKQWICDLEFGSYGIPAPMDLGQTEKCIDQGDGICMLKKCRLGQHPLKAGIEALGLTNTSLTPIPRGGSILHQQAI
jgi:N-hydroxyarylamine O-acetyltransferase